MPDKPEDHSYGHSVDHFPDGTIRINTPNSAKPAKSALNIPIIGSPKANANTESETRPESLLTQMMAVMGIPEWNTPTEQFAIWQIIPSPNEKPPHQNLLFCTPSITTAKDELDNISSSLSQGHRLILTDELTDPPTLLNFATAPHPSQSPESHPEAPAQQDTSFDDFVDQFTSGQLHFSHSPASSPASSLTESPAESPAESPLDEQPQVLHTIATELLDHPLLSKKFLKSNQIWQNMPKSHKKAWKKLKRTLRDLHTRSMKAYQLIGQFPNA